MDVDVRALRVTAVNTAPVAARGAYVLYWMIAARRATHSFALDHAIGRSLELGKPLVVLEALRTSYPWASDRMHAFVLQGMADNAAAFAAAGVTYHAYVERAEGEGRGLLAALAAKACLVVTDEQPGFFLPRMVASAGEQLPVRLEQVDGTGLLPLRASPKAWPTAAVFRRHLQKTVPPHLAQRPAAKPFARFPRTLRDADLPKDVVRRWPAATPALLAADRAALARLPIDHAIAPAQRGGAAAGEEVLDAFIEHGLPRYGEGRNHPDDDAASGLSPYLHFGHVSAHAVAERVWADARWDPSRVAGAKATGSREGWWGMPAPHESFMDEVVTWRELGHVFCFHRTDFDQWSALPEWARKTLDEHAKDHRPEHYTPKQLDAAETADPVWNAAQRELVATGRMHNYLRMLWGKKILEWSPSPKRALATMIELNNRYALDGRDPNSYCGILWTLGAFDRPWAPIRPIFGSVRFMSSASTVKKLRMKKYLAQWS